MVQGALLSKFIICIPCSVTFSPAVNRELQAAREDAHCSPNDPIPKEANLEHAERGKHLVHRPRYLADGAEQS